jgi:CrcB protein
VTAHGPAERDEFGKALGDGLRYGVARGRGGRDFPGATLAVNVVGSFAIALYATLAEPEGRLKPSPRQRYFVTAGLCGGFTTFSAV